MASTEPEVNNARHSCERCLPAWLSVKNEDLFHFSNRQASKRAGETLLPQIGDGEIESEGKVNRDQRECAAFRNATFKSERASEFFSS